MKNDPTISNNGTDKVQYFNQTNIDPTQTGLMVLIENSLGTKTYIYGYYHSDGTPDYNNITHVVSTTEANDTADIYAYHNGEVTYCYKALLSSQTKINSLVKISKRESKLYVDVYEHTWDTIPPVSIASISLKIENGSYHTDVENSYLRSSNSTDDNTTTEVDVFHNDWGRDLVTNSMTNVLSVWPYVGGVVRSAMNWNKNRDFINKKKDEQNSNTIKDEFSDVATASNTPFSGSQTNTVEQLNNQTYVNLFGVDAVITGVNDCSNGDGSHWGVNLEFSSFTTVPSMYFVDIRNLTTGVSSYAQGTSNNTFVQDDNWCTVFGNASSQKIQVNISYFEGSILRKSNSIITTLSKPGDPVYHIVKVIGDNQSATANQFLSTPIKVRVLDAQNNPKPNIAVNFEVTAGGGSTVNATLTTDNNGFAQTLWKVGAQQSGAQSLDVSAKYSNGTHIDNSPVHFSASVQPYVNVLSNTTWIGDYTCPTWAPNTWPPNHVPGYTTAANHLPVKYVFGISNESQINATVTWLLSGVSWGMTGFVNSAGTTITWTSSYDQGLVLPETWNISGTTITGVENHTVSSGSCTGMPFVLHKQ